MQLRSVLGSNGNGVVAVAVVLDVMVVDVETEIQIHTASPVHIAISQLGSNLIFIQW